MADLAELISDKVAKAQDGDNISYKLNKGIAIVTKFGFELCGSEMDQITVCGSSRDGLKLSTIGDIADIDFMITNSDGDLQDKIEEKNFEYDDKFPCHCKFRVGGELVNREMMMRNKLPVSRRLWEIVKPHTYNKKEGGIQGYKVDDCLNKLPEIFKYIYLLKRILKETRERATQCNDTTETHGGSLRVNLRMSDFLIPGLKETLEIWEKEYSEVKMDQFLHIGLQFFGLSNAVLGTSDPEEAISKFLSDVFHEDTINADESSSQKYISNIILSGSTTQQQVISELLPYVQKVPRGAPFPKEVIAKLLSDLMPKFSVDWIAAFYVSGWPRPATEWISRDRNWPSKETVCSIETEGFNLVGKPSPEHGADAEEWYLSFARAEIKLCESLNEVQRLCYLAFKILVKYGVGDDDIRSYFLRTAFLWVCERADPADWTNDKLPKNLDSLLNFLIEAYRSKNLPHYFVPDMNLLGRIEVELEHCDNIVRMLSSIITNIPDCFNELFEKHGKFVVYDAIV